MSCWSHPSDQLVTNIGWQLRAGAAPLTTVRADGALLSSLTQLQMLHPALRACLQALGPGHHLLLHHMR